MDNVQVINNALIEHIEQPTMGMVRRQDLRQVFQSPHLRASGGPAPRIGEHTDAILAEAGYSAAEIEAMKSSRVARAATSVA